MQALLEVAEATPVEVTQEEVSNEEGYITSISGALSSASASTSVPTTASISPSAAFCNPAVLVGWFWFWFCFDEDKLVMADFLVDLASITSSKASPDMAMAAL